MIMMAISPDLIETTSIDDKPTVKRYVHRVTAEKYISYFHALNGAWTPPFVEGSRFDVLSRGACEESALANEGALPVRFNGGFVSGSQPVNSDTPDLSKMHPVDRANYEREQLQALGNSLQSGIPPLAAIGQPISCESVTPEYWEYDLDKCRLTSYSMPLPYGAKNIKHFPEKREPLIIGRPVSLTGDPVELEKTKTGDTSQVKCFTVRDDSRSFPGNIDGCYEVIKGLRGQVSQLREEAIYAKDEADSIRVSLQSALDIKKKYHAETIRLNKLDEQNRKIIADVYRDNRDLQFSVDKLRSVTQVQRRAMLAASVLLFLVFIATVLGW